MQITNDSSTDIFVQDEDSERVTRLSPGNSLWFVSPRPSIMITSIIPLHGLLPDGSGRTCCDVEPKACDDIEELAAAHERRGVTHFILPGGGTCCDLDPKRCEG